MTGYAKNEAQGRNCRFLQGPRTEPQSVAVIQDTLRRGVDCHVKLTNYRKTGETFENLLTMRPVHDSNGVMRFCIGVQFEVTRDLNLKSRLAKLDKLIKLLPNKLEVSSIATGAVHAKGDNFEATDLAVKLESALAGASVGPQLEGFIAKDGFYSENHMDMLSSIGDTPLWTALHTSLGMSDTQSGTGQSSQASGAAASHAHAARHEAARKLITHHKAVIGDVTNPAPKTQLELKRVGTEHKEYVDQAMREVSRRLLGTRAGGQPLPQERLDPSRPAQAAAWAATAQYLTSRLHTPGMPPHDRTPDMSTEAAAAMRAVLQEVGSGTAVSDIGGSPQWAPLHQVISGPGSDQPTEADGAAGGHGHSARHEALRKLLSNHMALLNDVTNPAPKTQLELRRVGAEHKEHVDQALREVGRRLFGRRPGMQPLPEERSSQPAVWAATALYVSARLQAPGMRPTERAPAARASVAATSGRQT